MASSNSAVNYKPDDNQLRQWYAEMQKFKINDTFCDITLIAENKEFKAHRVILAASIPFFSGLLQNNFKENRKNQVLISEIEPEILENLINVSYGNQLGINHQNVEKLLIGADYLQLNHVKAACKDYLKTHLTSDTALVTKEIAERLHCFELVSAAEKFIDNNFPDFAKTENFLSLEKQQLIELLKSDGLKVKEEEVYAAVMKWIKYEGPDRIPLLPEVLSYVRMSLLPPAYLYDVVSNESLIRVSNECRDLLDEAMAYHMMAGSRKLPKTIRNTPRNQLVGSVYILGGRNGIRLSSPIQIYNPQEDKWTIECKIIHVKDAASAVFEGKLYIFGGLNENNQRSSSVNIYDFKSKKVTRGAPMALKIAFSAAAVLGDDIVLSGGCNGSKSLNFAQRYSPKTNTWTKFGPLNQRRSGSTAVSLNNSIFVIGGYSHGSPIDSCEKYDPESNSWIDIKPMLTPRNLAASAVLDGKIYVCGGRTSRENRTNSVQIYDPVSKAWTHAPPMNVKRSSLALVSLNGKLYAIGGIGGYDDTSKSILSSTEVFDPATNTWTFVDSLPEATYGMSFGEGF